MKRLCLSLIIACMAVGLLCSASMAQGGMGGPFNGPNSLRYYVDPVNGSNGNWGTVTSPWKTLTHAMAIANGLVLATPPYTVTINVLGGTCSTATGETFPIQMMSKGIALEALSQNTTTILGDGVNDVIQVTDPLLVTAQDDYAALPDSLIQGFSITNGYKGILFEPGLGPNSPFDFTQRVTVRYCELTNNETGIYINLATDWRAAHIIEKNHIHHNLANNSAGQNNNVGILQYSEGYSSTLIRSNDIHDHEFNILIHGANPPDVCPRIFSNFCYLANVSVSLHQCTPRVVNNTIAYGRDQTAVTPIPQIMTGLSYTGSFVTPAQIVVANNIIWVPNDPQTGFMGQDLSLLLNGSTATILQNNLTAPLAGNVNSIPGFVTANYPTYTFDLHLVAGSPMVGMANRTFVDSGVAGVPMYVNVGSPTVFTVRSDVGRDIDWDSRIIDFWLNFPYNKLAFLLLDIGADEVVHHNLTVSGNVDAQGNVLFPSTTNPPVSITFTVAGNAVTNSLQAGDMIYLYFWNNFLTYPVDQNLLAPPFGNFLLDLSVAYIAAAGPVGVGSTYSATFPVPYPIATDYEFETYVQAFRLIPGTSVGDFSNIVRIEYNEVP